MTRRVIVNRFQCIYTFYNGMTTNVLYQSIKCLKCSLLLDYDECLSDDENDCHVKAFCTNTNGEGSYICECNAGFTGDGFNCTGKFIQPCTSWKCMYIWK